jgi:hypothetical protein
MQIFTWDDVARLPANQKTALATRVYLASRPDVQKRFADVAQNFGVGHQLNEERIQAIREANVEFLTQELNTFMRFFVANYEDAEYYYPSMRARGLNTTEAIVAVRKNAVDATSTAIVRQISLYAYQARS